MPDITIDEGGLSFRFTDVGFASKYDDWSHYRNQFQRACGSSKAVDFLVSKGSTLWLIEVKDFRRHPRTNPSELADDIAEKVRDTMAGLMSAKHFATNLEESSISRAALKCKKLRIALHLEQPKNPSRLFPTSIDPANLSIKLKQKIRFADPHTVITNIRSFPPDLGTVVSI
ncbi:hypothetical protein [Roseovarius dicentrarchi]|uniref:hypothetical protein n=1 Tax=Roseovarius dicentrarchi TaxID=2250573 RepID=UPI001939DFE8|nr:hypothetical protein [Roseovarius dicentrarchi]